MDRLPTNVERSQPRRGELDKLLVSHFAVVLQEVGFPRSCATRQEETHRGLLEALQGRHLLRIVLIESFWDNEHTATYSS